MFLGCFTILCMYECVRVCVCILYCYGFIIKLLQKKAVLVSVVSMLNCFYKVDSIGRLPLFLFFF